MKIGELKFGGNFGLRSPISNLCNSLLTLIYPRSCRICEKSVECRADGLVCAKCWRETRIFTGKEIICHKCGAFLHDGFSDFETFCQRCDEDFYDTARAVGIYDKALMIAVLSLKNQSYIPKTLENLLRKTFLDSPFLDATRIVPVPLSKRRFTERGFNQALLLAKSLSEHAGLKINDKSLVRKIHTPKHRAGMDRKSRFETVKNAFEIEHPRLIEGERIVLIDDVFTSGATVSNCAKVLKESGAEKVYVLTIARVV